ncbi:UNVERIFIED_CONTAM: hypothetical protein FKN15_056863 [Acipenser sinensis]
MNHYMVPEVNKTIKNKQVNEPDKTCRQSYALVVMSVITGDALSRCELYLVAIAHNTKEDKQKIALVLTIAGTDTGSL